MSTKSYYRGFYNSNVGIVNVTLNEMVLFNGSESVKFKNCSELDKYNLRIIYPNEAIKLGISSLEDYINTIRYKPFFERLRYDDDISKIFNFDEERYSLIEFKITNICEVMHSYKIGLSEDSIRIFFDCDLCDEENDERVYNRFASFFVPESVAMALKGDLEILYPKWKESIIKKHNERMRAEIEANIKALTEKLKKYE